jgi:hypothetical protein
VLPVRFSPRAWSLNALNILSRHLYRANPTTTLNCWSEVAAFRSSVAELEQVCGHFRSIAPNTDSVPSRNMLIRYGSNNSSRLINLSLS